MSRIASCDELSYVEVCYDIEKIQVNLLLTPLFIEPNELFDPHAEKSSLSSIICWSVPLGFKLSCSKSALDLPFNVCFGSTIFTYCLVEEVLKVGKCCSLK